MGQNNETRPVRIVILDDHPVVVRGLQEFLEDAPGFEVVGTAQNLNEFLKSVKETQPDIAIVDLKLSTHSSNEEIYPSGIEAIKRVQTLPSPPRCIAYTAFPQYGREALEAGKLAGYILKDSSMDEVLTVIKDVLDNKFVAPREVMDQFRHQGTNSIDEQESGLTKRELEVLCLWVNYPKLTREGIAKILDISPGTVKTHLNNIYPKLQVQTRTESALKAQELGLLGKCKSEHHHF